MDFEWDDDKAEANEQKHGVSFSEAQTVFADPLALTGYDPGHSDVEDRFITMSPEAVQPDDELRPEYDFRTMRGVVRGKYAASYRERPRLVRLAADVAAEFPDEAAVNAALRAYLRSQKAADVQPRVSAP